MSKTTPSMTTFFRFFATSPISGPAPSFLGFGAEKDAATHLGRLLGAGETWSFQEAPPAITGRDRQQRESAINLATYAASPRELTETAGDAGTVWHIGSPLPGDAFSPGDLVASTLDSDDTGVFVGYMLAPSIGGHDCIVAWDNGNTTEATAAIIVVA